MASVYKMIMLWDETFPQKCPDANCDGMCEFSVKVGKKFFCSQKNLLNACFDRTGQQDFSLYWSFDLNPNVNPLLLGKRSQDKYWFTCPKSDCGHHVWSTSIKSFVHDKSRCPFCSGNRTCPCSSVAVLNPEILDYWHSRNKISPSEVSSGSNVKVWFKCPLATCDHHEWMTSIYNFTSGNRCPFCVNRKCCPCNSVVVLNPEILTYWHPRNKISPSEISTRSEVKVWFKCPLATCDHHEWISTVNDFTKGVKCPFCTNKRACSCNSIATKVPTIIRYWHEENTISPHEIMLSYNKLVWLRCPKPSCRRTWQIKVRNFAKTLSCPFCSDKF